MFLYIWKMQIFKYLFHFDFISQCWVCKVSALASWELQSQCVSSIGREVGFCLAYKEFMKSNKLHMAQGWEVNKFSFLLSGATFRLFLSIYTLIKSSSLRFTLYRLHHAYPFASCSHWLRDCFTALLSTLLPPLPLKIDHLGPWWLLSELQFSRWVDVKPPEGSVQRTARPDSHLKRITVLNEWTN